MKSHKMIISLAFCTLFLTGSLLQGCGNGTDISDTESAQVTIPDTSDNAENSEPENKEVIELKDGYYGYVTGDGTKYSLGINIEGFTDYYFLNVINPNTTGQGVSFEGKFSKNADSTYKAEVSSDVSNTRTGKSFTITPTEQGVTLSSDDTVFNDIVGVYPYLGESEEAFENLSADNIKESDGIALNDYLGYWQDTTNGNCTIDIEKENDFPVVYISWYDFKDETYYWELYPEYDEESNSLVYPEGSCYLEGDSRLYLYRNGTGKFYIKDDYLYWVDDIDKAGDGYTFGRVRPQDLLEQTYNNGSVSLESDTNIDLTDKDLQENDIFSETDYKVMEQIPEVDFSASAIGISLEEFEQMINWDMVECGEYGKRALFKNYFAPRGINESQCDNITFYQRAGDVETNQKYYRDIVGVKNGKIVIYCGIVSSSEIRDILSYIDTDPLKVQIDYSDYVYFWKGNNCYISMHENTLPGEAENFENTKKYYNTYNVDGIRITYLGDLHYSQWFKYGMPMGVVLGGD